MSNNQDTIARDIIQQRINKGLLVQVRIIYLLMKITRMKKSFLIIHFKGIIQVFLFRTN